ncbi:MAG: DNA-protecting protein DprA [Bacteroidetes bacterium]|nr:MAG: DNA-protecting protein DprA [Bacteroidota bacterium]TAG89654.1 MAG: DNA-protecting protein DprA [Bacteroidota bacterium]
MKKNDLFYQVALSLIDGIGGKNARLLFMYCGSAQNIFQKWTTNQFHQTIPGIGLKTAQKIEDSKKEVFKKATEIIEKCEEYNVKILSLFEKDTEFPDVLRNYEDSPLLMYYKGNATLNDKKIIGIVGTRQATDYGRDAVEKILTELAPYKPLIISGLAYGIDIAAHKTALKLGLETIGVMASGLDIIYPAEHKKIAFEMLENGGLLTENPFGTTPDARRFPARNRIIAGMSDALVVVEAQIKGGAVITADIANDYNKDVFAVPGSIKSEASLGCNLLIQQNKAMLVNSGADIIQFLEWDNAQKINKQIHLDLDTLDLTEIEKKILKHLKEKGQTQIDVLAYQIQKPVQELNALLLNLELLNLIKSIPGQKYSLKN